jgi:uncharacterized protein
LRRSFGASDLKVLLVTGGHPFRQEPFFQVFREMNGVKYEHAVLGSGAERFLTPTGVAPFDALVFYDMNQNCQPYIADLTSILREGKGTVFLHHAIGSCADWEIYGRLLGGRARFTPDSVDGVRLSRADFKGGISYRAYVADKTHPITQGVDDFDITDEVYRAYYVSSEAQILLRTDHPASGGPLMWTHQFGKSKTVYFQPGHAESAYRNPSFRRLLERSIQWVAQP